MSAEIDDAARIEGPPFDGPTTRGAMALRGITAAVVVGDQAVTTALVAIGAARGVARTRTVTIVDLIGDVPALRALAADDDPHGVADCFVYGISPKAVTRRTHADDRLFVIPGGTEPLDHATMVPSVRWGRLVAEYRAEGALLLFVAAVRTPGLADLVSQTDGLIAVGEIDALLPPGARVLATAQRPSRERRRVPRTSGRTRRRRAWRRSAAIGLAAVVVVAATTWLALGRPGMRPTALANVPSVPPAPSTQTISNAQLGPSSPTPPAAAATPTPTPGDVPANPADSATAAAYTRLVATLPRYADALRLLRRQHTTLTAATISPLADTAGTVHYALLAGAFGDSASAGPPAVRAPLALVLRRNMAPDSAVAAADRYLARGIPAYVLANDSNGRATVYAGAFNGPQAAHTLTASLRAAGLVPVLAYRTGRPI
ncbi:MAG TPA: hypothetical protein VNW46_06240 [Gemmatimonadaceae bacterium]|nr:hypothetical protein [Gemmatimonadaceae bacterium]